MKPTPPPKRPDPEVTVATMFKGPDGWVCITAALPVSIIRAGANVQESNPDFYAIIKEKFHLAIANLFTVRHD